MTTEKSSLTFRENIRQRKKDPKRRAAHDRCARCKKVRKMWMRANEWEPTYCVSFKNVPGEGKVCWICVIREIEPDWRPGQPIPEECFAYVRNSR